MVGAKRGNLSLFHQLLPVDIDRHCVFLFAVEIQDCKKQADMGGADPVILPDLIHEMI